MLMLASSTSSSIFYARGHRQCRFFAKEFAKIGAQHNKNREIRSHE